MAPSSKRPKLSIEIPISRRSGWAVRRTSAGRSMVEELGESVVGAGGFSSVDAGRTADERQGWPWSCTPCFPVVGGIHHKLLFCQELTMANKPFKNDPNRTGTLEAEPEHGHHHPADPAAHNVGTGVGAAGGAAARGAARGAPGGAAGGVGGGAGGGGGGGGG